jgi:hypothetical protein
MPLVSDTTFNSSKNLMSHCVIYFYYYFIHFILEADFNQSPLSSKLNSSHKIRYFNNSILILIMFIQTALLLKCIVVFLNLYAFYSPYFNSFSYFFTYIK